MTPLFALLFATGLFGNMERNGVDPGFKDQSYGIRKNTV